MLFFVKNRSVFQTRQEHSFYLVSKSNRSHSFHNGSVAITSNTLHIQIAQTESAEKEHTGRVYALPVCFCPTIILRRCVMISLFTGGPYACSGRPPASQSRYRRACVRCKNREPSARFVPSRSRVRFLLRQGRRFWWPDRPCSGRWRLR